MYENIYKNSHKNIHIDIDKKHKFRHTLQSKTNYKIIHVKHIKNS